MGTIQHDNINGGNKTMELTFVFTIMIFTLTLIVLGVLTQYKIFSIFSVGGLITLIVMVGGMFDEAKPETDAGYFALIIVLSGLIIFQLWYATIGSR